jgi:hypothetical protein
MRLDRPRPRRLSERPVPGVALGIRPIFAALAAVPGTRLDRQGRRGCYETKIRPVCSPFQVRLGCGPRMRPRSDDSILSQRRRKEVRDLSGDLRGGSGSGARQEARTLTTACRRSEYFLDENPAFQSLGSESFPWPLKPVYMPGWLTGSREL